MPATPTGLAHEPRALRSAPALARRSDDIQEHSA
jgi:hypothetical protein